jgi:hypothetical protein
MVWANPGPFVFRVGTRGLRRSKAAATFRLEVAGRGSAASDPTHSGRKAGRGRVMPDAASVSLVSHTVYYHVGLLHLGTSQKISTSYLI